MWRFSFHPGPAPQHFDSQHSWAQFQQVTQGESREYLILRNSNRGLGQGRSREVKGGLTTPNTLGYGQRFRRRGREAEDPESTAKTEYQIDSRRVRFDPSMNVDIAHCRTDHLRDAGTWSTAMRQHSRPRINHHSDDMLTG